MPKIRFGVYLFLLQKIMNLKSDEHLGRGATIEEWREELLTMPLENFSQVPFALINKLLGTKFTSTDNGQAHKFLHEALQKVTRDEDMKKAVELVLKDDGLMIRVCMDEDATLGPQVYKLAEALTLTHRITHSCCPRCKVKRIKKVEDRRNGTKEDVDLTVYRW